MSLNKAVLKSSKLKQTQMALHPVQDHHIEFQLHWLSSLDLVTCGCSGGPNFK